MSDCNDKKMCADSDKNCNKDKSSNQTVQMQVLIRGLLALFFGLLFVGFAYRIVVRMLFFGAGVSLIYYGFRVLGVTQVTDAVDQVIAKIKRVFWS